MIKLNKIKKIVVKVGSSLIANYKTGSIRESWVKSFVEDLNILFKKNIKILIVSSGAIAIGRKKIGFQNKLFLRKIQRRHSKRKLQTMVKRKMTRTKLEIFC